jgi:flagellin-like protein
MKKPVCKDARAVSPVIAVILMVAITVVLAGVLYVWVTQIAQPPDDDLRQIVASLDQGDGNMTSGCLFTLTKGSGDKVRIEEYSIKVSEEDRSPVTLEWPEDGNSTYTLDSKQYANDGDYWDATERMGFDAPPGLTGIEDGEVIEVSIVHMESDTVVFSSKFNYHD